jgi:hypothetical protein
MGFCYYSALKESAFYIYGPTASLLRNDFVENASSIKLSRRRVKEPCPLWDACDSFFGHWRQIHWSEPATNHSPTRSPSQRNAGDFRVVCLGRRFLPRSTEAHGSRPEIRQHSGTGVYHSRHCDGRHCRCSLCDNRQEYRPRRPAPGNRIANRHRICGAAGPSGLRSIPFDAHPGNEALTDFRKRFAVFFRDEITCILSAMQFKSV